MKERRTEGLIQQQNTAVFLMLNTLKERFQTDTDKSWK